MLLLINNVLLLLFAGVQTSYLNRNEKDEDYTGSQVWVPLSWKNLYRRSISPRLCHRGWGHILITWSPRRYRVLMMIKGRKFDFFVSLGWSRFHLRAGHVSTVFKQSVNRNVLVKSHATLSSHSSVQYPWSNVDTALQTFKVIEAVLGWRRRKRHCKQNKKYGLQIWIQISATLDTVFQRVLSLDDLTNASK